VLLKQATLAGIAAGAISLVFRRWQRARVSAGSTFRTSAGVVAVDQIERVAVADLSARDARRAGYASLGALCADLAAQCGLATLPFKQRVRRLKELGLTESPEVGYRLSLRGRALLRRVKA